MWYNITLQMSQMVNQFLFYKDALPKVTLQAGNLVRVFEIIP